MTSAAKASAVTLAASVASQVAERMQSAQGHRSVTPAKGSVSPPQTPVKQIVTEIKVAVEETPPELLADIMASGIQLAGGGSLLRGLDVLIQKETKIPTKLIEDPMTAVVRGAGMILENLDELGEVLVETDSLEPPK